MKNKIPLLLSIILITSVSYADLVPNPFISQLPYIEKKSKKLIEQKKFPNKYQNQTNLNVRKNQGYSKDDPVQEDIIPPLPKLEISGIVWNTPRPQAIINGQVVDIGDNLNEIKIVTIKKTGISILYYGQIMTISP